MPHNPRANVENVLVPVQQLPTLLSVGSVHYGLLAHEQRYLGDPAWLRCMERGEVDSQHAPSTNYVRKQVYYRPCHSTAYKDFQRKIVK